MRFVKSVVAILVGMILAAGAVAQQPAQRYPIIAGITVEGLTEGADMATVIAYSGLRIGQEARPDDLVMAVRNLWNRRTFKDVRIEREREGRPGSSVRVALGSVGPVILRAPEAEALVAAHVDFEAGALADVVVDQAAELAAAAARPIDDHRSTAAYRRHAIRVLTARQLRRAFPRGAS